jgi:hypothetical protein
VKSNPTFSVPWQFVQALKGYPYVREMNKIL